MAEGTWSVPTNLGEPVNSSGRDLQPTFAANAPNTMYWSSDREGKVGIYRSVQSGSTWSKPELIVSGYVGEPSLVGDGSIMYFVNVLVDDNGVFGSDVWYTRRKS